VFLRKTWNAALLISLSASELKVIDERASTFPTTGRRYKAMILGLLYY
jgi:hypothetical protein